MIALVVLVISLGAAVLALQLLPQGAPETLAEREIALWERMEAQNPESAWAKSGLGVALFNAGQIGRSRALFEETVDIDPEHWNAWIHLGIIATDSNPDLAEEYLTRAADFAPRSSKAPAYIALGDLLMLRGDPAGARAAYEGAVADLPFLVDGQLGLARALEALGDREGAIAQYRRAADFSPANPEIEEALIRLGADGQ